MKNTIDSSRECDHWVRVAESYLASSEEETRAASYSELQDHVQTCSSCQREIGGLLETDRSLHRAFAFLERALPAPPQDSLAIILSKARSSPDTSLLLKRIRRPVNTTVWIAVIASSFAALAGLIWCAAWLVSKLTG